MEPDKQMGNITGRRDEEGNIKGGIKFFTDRFRTCYGAAGTTSTRFNSKSSNFWDGTNAQNIRASMRDFLVADEGCISWTLTIRKAMTFSWDTNRMTRNRSR